MRARYYSRRKLRGRGVEDYVEESLPKPIASQAANEKALVKIIEQKIEFNSIIDKKKSKPKKIEYISTEALLK